MPAVDDVLILGGGIIGLSWAYALAKQGARVRVLERGEPGREASWAGAGILPPPGTGTVRALAPLAALSAQLHPAWAAELREETGIDNGYRRCGGVYLAHTAAEAVELEQSTRQWRARDVTVEPLTLTQLTTRLPCLKGTEPRAAYFLSAEAQIRNPRHLQALVAACQRRGVQITVEEAVEDFEVSGDRVVAVRTSSTRWPVNKLGLAAGAWSGGLAARLGLRLAVHPVRGQMLLVRVGGDAPRSIVNVGKRYLVPRFDGRLLVGSTEENAGFDKRTTVEGLAGLMGFLVAVAPSLKQSSLEQSWSGLRPATADGLPYLGRAPELKNAFVAAGHFRSGLELSCATGVAMAQLLLEGRTHIDLAPFRLDRPEAEPVTPS